MSKSRKFIDPAVLAAIIGLIGVIITATCTFAGTVFPSVFPFFIPTLQTTGMATTPFIATPTFTPNTPSTPIITPEPIPTITLEPIPTITLEPIPTITLEPTSTITSEPISTLGEVSTKASQADGISQMYIPEGVFQMGTFQGGDNPLHSVFLDAFWIDQTEVTNAMYAQCVMSGICSAPKSYSSATRPNYYGNATFDNYPVIRVNWEQAYTYCLWANRELPTEAQWEKAARGTDTRKWPWNDEDRPSSALTNIGGYAGDTTPVATYSKDKSPYGVFDMGGNVKEWVADWYDDNYYYNSPIDIPINPKGPSNGKYRVVRGSGWNSASAPASGARVAVRYFIPPKEPFDNLGFRCAEKVP